MKKIKEHLRYFWIVVMAILLVVIALCSIMFLSRPTINENSLIGAYMCEFSFGTEKLILNKNGEYIQVVKINDNPKTITHKGKWHFAEEDNYVELKNGLAVQTGFGQLRSDYNIPFNGVVLRKVEPTIFTRHLRLASSLEGLYYIKVRPNDQ